MITVRRCLPLLTATVMAALVGLVAAQPAGAAAGARRVSCTSLKGAGTWADPTRLGALNAPVVVVNCPALRVGYGYNTRYFSFTLRSAATPRSATLTFYPTNRPVGVGGVWPGLFSGPWQVRDSLASAYWRDGAWEGRYQVLSGLPAGSYRLRVTKPSSAAAAMVSARYHVLVVP